MGLMKYLTLFPIAALLFFNYEKQQGSFSIEHLKIKSLVSCAFPLNRIRIKYFNFQFKSKI